MANHTTFRVGGPADLYAVPEHIRDLQTLLACARSEEMAAFILGGGANILVADSGIRGLVIDMAHLNSIRAETNGHDTVVAFEAGMPVSDAAGWMADRNLAGLEFVYAMPGSVAGAVWMNARCYGSEISTVLAFADVLSRDGVPRRYTACQGDFAYKDSPFQHNDLVITRVGIRATAAKGEELWKVMREHEEDRRTKGHFAAPCAGSVFKNNRAFGAPSGAILDKLGLRGYSVGGAKVSDLHANIIINAGNATAADIRNLSDHMAREAKEKLGFDLEREVLLVGDWGDT